MALSLKNILLSNGVVFKDDKIYIPPNIKRIKLDIGIAIEAIHTEYWLNNNPDDLLVFGFEPLPACVDACTAYFSQTESKWKHVSPNNIINPKWLNNNFIIVPVAIGNESGKLLDFHVTTTNNIGCSSLYKPSSVLLHNHGIGLSHTIKVPVFKLSDFIELLPFDVIKYIEYVKVDVQGNDLNVIRSGGKCIEDNVVFVTMEPETSQYIGAEENNSANMISYMNSIGFDYIDHPNTEDPTFLNRKFKNNINDIHIKQFN
jgi:FkbM family methyltransferase